MTKYETLTDTTNIILNTDSYKSSHFKGYPPNTKHVYSYIESRGGEYDEIPFLGLTFFLEQIMRTRVTEDMVNEAEKFWTQHVGFFNREMWDIIVREYGGRLPVTINALPEGTVTKPGVPMLTMYNTDPRMPALTSYLETALLRAIWYPSTVGARIRKIKQSILPFFEMSSDTRNTDYALLDFSARGCASEQSSLLGTYAYLTMFSGSDSAMAVYKVSKFFDKEMVGYSVPATEHSIMCAFGRDNEAESFEYILDNMSIKGAPLSVVSDTWNIFAATDKWVALADKVREKGVTLVIRPDSGDINTVLPAILGKLEAGFGYTTNALGYKVLNDVKVLWGDGINESNAYVPFMIATNMGISADCIMIGSGGGLMETNLDRDTCKFAMKASSMVIDYSLVDIYKDPITDPGKKSKAGVFGVDKDTGEWYNVPRKDCDEPYDLGLLRIAYTEPAFADEEETELFNNFDDIKARVNLNL